MESFILSTCAWAMQWRRVGLLASSSQAHTIYYFHHDSRFSWSQRPGRRDSAAATLTVQPFRNRGAAVFAGKHHDPFISSCPRASAGPFSGSAALETQSGEIVISGTNQAPR
jgi:hypothetical protein